MAKKQKKTIREEIEKEFDKKFTELYGKKVFIRLDTGEEYQALLTTNAVRVKDFIFDILRQTLQRFIEETKVSFKVCNSCGKIIDEDFRDWDGTLKCPHCGEWAGESWDAIGYNEALKDINQKQQQWLRENLLR